jgi:hypothetical protein
LLRRLAVTVVVALGCAPHFGNAANAANCAPLEMRLMQLQARNDPDSAELREAKSLLAQCNGAEPVAAFQSWGEIPSVGEGQRRDKPTAERRQRAGPPKNTVRTLCVRACDGYYFPISFSTMRKYLEADEAACQRMCPAGDASLYYHSRREGPAQMVSIDGAPYSELENAFRYRSVLDTSCTCGTPLSIETAEVVLATYSDEPAAAEHQETSVDQMGELIETSSVTPAGLTDPTVFPEAIRVILPTGNEEQDRLVVSSVPGKWFQKEPDVIYPRGPGDIGCLSRGPSCQPQ